MFLIDFHIFSVTQQKYFLIIEDCRCNLVEVVCMKYFITQNIYIKVSTYNIMYDYSLPMKMLFLIFKQNCKAV